MAEVRGNIVYLSPGDRTDINITAWRRQQNKVRRGVKTRKQMEDETDDELHYVGVMGEFAAAVFLGFPEALDRRIFHGGDDGVDLVIQGDRYSVKTICRRYPQESHLKLFDWEWPPEKYCDFLILPKLAQTTVLIAGVIGAKEFQEIALVHGMRDFGYGDRWWCSEDEMLDPVKFREEMYGNRRHEDGNAGATAGRSEAAGAAPRTHPAADTRPDA